MRRYLIVGAVFLLIILGGYYGVGAIFSTESDIPTVEARAGELLISQKVSGVVDAARAWSITAPRIRGLQITWLAPEGSRVNEGDTVIKFDATTQLAELTDNESSLKINQTSLSRAQQEYTIQKKNLELELQKAQRKYDEQKHEAPKVAEEARLELELAELNIQAKLDQLQSDVEKAELEVQRARDRVNESQRELSQLSMTAPIPGMVVYLEIWKGGTMGKVQEGDSPWPGQGLINLPDLAEMIVKATVSEVDAAQIDSGQSVLIRLDAVQDKVYDGMVTKKGTLARRKDPNSKINVFDVEIAMNDEDDQVKPGMSASGRVVINRIEDVIKVPLESVFEKEGKTIVYKGNKDPVEVTVGQRNDMEIAILDGLKDGQKVCTVDPTLDAATLPGDKATEPELNKGRETPSQGGGRRGGRKR